MKKLRIAILFGGCSPEYEVSLKSAFNVIAHMDSAKYDPILLGITRLGEWFCHYGAHERISDDTWNSPSDCARAIISPDRETHGILCFDKEKPRPISLDAAMPVLHGKNGEDGTVQGLLELAGIPVVGCGALSSALCMNKDMAHKIASAAGIRVPRAYTLDGASDIDETFEQAKQIGYPLFVKPLSAGSSFGITKVLSESELPNAIKLAFEYDDEVIVEESIPGFEVGCGVLGNGSPTVGAVDEINWEMTRRKTVSLIMMKNTSAPQRESMCRPGYLSGKPKK